MLRDGLLEIPGAGATRLGPRQECRLEFSSRRLAKARNGEKKLEKRVNKSNETKTSVPKGPDWADWHALERTVLIIPQAGGC